MHGAAAGVKPELCVGNGLRLLTPVTQHTADGVCEKSVKDSTNSKHAIATRVTGVPILEKWRDACAFPITWDVPSFEEV
jgi:hypothetical protein